MSEMPYYNPGAAAYQPAQAPVAPPIMNTIFFMLLSAAVLQILATILGAMTVNSENFRNQITSEIEGQNVKGVTAQVIDTTVLFALVGVIVVGVVAVIAYVIFGLFIKRGLGWARIVGLVLAIASLSQLFNMTMPAGIVTILQVLLGIGAIVLCFTGPAAVFFTEKKNFRLANKVR